VIEIYVVLKRPHESLTLATLQILKASDNFRHFIKYSKLHTAPKSLLILKLSYRISVLSIGTFYWKQLRMQSDSAIRGLVAAGIVFRGPDTMCGIFWEA